MSIAVELASPLIPLASLKIAMAAIAGHRRPKTWANWP